MSNDALSKTIDVYNQLGRKYTDKVSGLIIPSIKEFVKMFLPGDKILDVGCAGGRDSHIFTLQGLESTGIDLSQRFIQIAKEDFPRLKFVCADARKLCFQDQIFDGIWANAVLLNMKRSEAASFFENLNFVLKSGGILFVAVKEGRGEKLAGEPLVENLTRRETYFEKTELENLLRLAGFQILKWYLRDDTLNRSSTKWLEFFAKKRRMG